MKTLNSMALRKLSLDERKTNIKVFIELIRDTYPEQCYDVINKNLTLTLTVTVTLTLTGEIIAEREMEK